MENKFNLTRKQNVFVAKKNIVDYIWKSTNLEGIDVTYFETQAIYDGGVVNGLTVDNIIAIHNLKYAWQFILENEDIDYDFKTLTHIHRLTCDKLVLDQIMIDHGCGIITISQENQPIFFEKLIRFYETGNNTELKQWIYETSIDGIDLNK